MNIPSHLRARLESEFKAQGFNFNAKVLTKIVIRVLKKIEQEELSRRLAKLTQEESKS